MANKTDVIDEVASRLSLDKKDVRRVINEAFDVIKDFLVEEKSVQVRDFATFNIKPTKEKTITQIRTKELLTIPAHYKLSVDWGKEFVNEVRNLPIQTPDFK